MANPLTLGARRPQPRSRRSRPGPCKVCEEYRKLGRQVRTNIRQGYFRRFWMLLQLVNQPFTCSPNFLHSFEIQVPVKKEGRNNGNQQPKRQEGQLYSRRTSRHEGARHRTEVECKEGG